MLTASVSKLVRRTSNVLSVLTTPSCQLKISNFGQCHLRRNHAGPGHPRHHSLVQDIRNIGIIAHVDAVRLCPPPCAERH